ncbi:MAG TPA: hypothetical protein V6D47_10415 [Oscillatoriaceae cyanobacterium]
MPQTVNGVQLNTFGELPPPNVQQGDRQVLFFDTLSTGTFEQMLSSLPKRIPAAQADVLLIHLNQDKIAGGYAVQSTGGNWGGGHGGDGHGSGSFGRGYPQGYGYSNYGYYPYYGYYYPYALYGGYYYPYTVGSYYPFYYYNGLTSLYSPYYYGGLGSGLLPPGYTGLPGTTPYAGMPTTTTQPTTAASTTAPMGQMPLSPYGQTSPYGPII